MKPSLDIHDRSILAVNTVCTVRREGHMKDSFDIREKCPHNIQRLLSLRLGSRNSPLKVNHYTTAGLHMPYPATIYFRG